MEIINTNKDLIGIDCDFCRHPIDRGVRDYFKGTIIIDMVTLEYKHACYSCISQLWNKNEKD